MAAAGIGALSGVCGLFASYYVGSSSGASIVPAASLIFVPVYLFAPRAGAVTSRVARRLHFAHPERDQFQDDEPAIEA